MKFSIACIATLAAVLVLPTHARHYGDVRTGDVKDDFEIEEIPWALDDYRPPQPVSQPSMLNIVSIARKPHPTGRRYHPKSGDVNADVETGDPHFTDPTPPTHHHEQKSRHEFESRIVGGEIAAPEEFNSMVSWNEQCGGSLIHDQLVLTAAHCGAIDGGVRIGSHMLYTGGVTRDVVQKVGHPLYDDSTNDNDYMILKLSEPVNINQYPPVQLNNDPSQPSTGEMLTVIGFGATSEGGYGSDRLQKVQVPTNSHEQCTNQYPGVQQSIHLCAGFTSGGKDSCQGDSGGPIFENRYGIPVQVGVVSYGDGCARPDRSGVYARVSGVYDWIQSQICELATVNLPESCPPKTSVPSDDAFALLTIEIELDDYPSETGWSITDSKNDTIYEYPPGTYSDFGTVYEQVKLSLGSEYTFNLIDSFGDGLNGHVVLYLGDTRDTSNILGYHNRYQYLHDAAWYDHQHEDGYYITEIPFEVPPSHYYDFFNTN